MEIAAAYIFLLVLFWMLWEMVKACKQIDRNRNLTSKRIQE